MGSFVSYCLYLRSCPQKYMSIQEYLVVFVIVCVCVCNVILYRGRNEVVFPSLGPPFYIKIENKSNIRNVSFETKWVS